MATIKEDNPFYETLDKLLRKDAGMRPNDPAGKDLWEEITEVRKKARRWEDDNTSYMTGERLKRK